MGLQGKKTKIKNIYGSWLERAYRSIDKRNSVSHLDYRHGTYSTSKEFHSIAVLEKNLLTR